MNLNTTLEQIQQISTQEIAQFSAGKLITLQQEANDALQIAKRTKDRISDALELRYKDQASVMRIQQGKDSGTVHFEDDGIEVTADLPKKVTWDQKQLMAMAKRIQASGEDPTQYMDVSYKVPERKYTSWPDSIKQAFQAARMFNTGHQTFKLKGEEK